MKKILTTVLLLLAATSAYTQFYLLPDGAPLLLNPALTGMHNGTLRVNTVYNPYPYGFDQKWRGITNTTSADYRTKSWSKGRQYAGIGMQYQFMGTTDYPIQTNTGKLFAAWHLRSKNSKRQLSAGVEYGREQIPFIVSFYSSNATYPEGQKAHINVRHLGAGLAYSQQLSNRIRLLAGARSAFPRYASDAETRYFTRNSKIHANHSVLLAGEIGLTPKWTIRPSFMYDFGFAINYLRAGVDVRYQPKKTAWFAGLWCPYQQNMGISTGAARNEWRILACYRMYRDKQPMHMYSRGLELSLQYVVKGQGRTALPCVWY